MTGLKTEQEIIEGAQVLIQAAHASGKHAAFVMLKDDGTVCGALSCNCSIGLRLGAAIIYQSKGV